MTRAESRYVVNPVKQPRSKRGRWVARSLFLACATIVIGWRWSDISMLVRSRWASQELLDRGFLVAQETDAAFFDQETTATWSLITPSSPSSVDDEALAEIVPILARLG